MASRGAILIDQQDPELNSSPCCRSATTNDLSSPIEIDQHSQDIKLPLSAANAHFGEVKNSGTISLDKQRLWQAIELLESCFPVIAPAISFTTEKLESRATSERWLVLFDLAAQ